MENNIIFGPVRSRRFGISLGVDLSPSLKQCNFDCLYCELAPSATTASQSDVVGVNAVVDQLKSSLASHGNIDVITITANGEPTLYPYLHDLICKIDKIKADTQTLILTNSATLTDERTFETLLKFDQVKLSLDAVSKDIFKKIDRPHEYIEISNIINSMIKFSKIYKGKLFIEILFVHTINDTEEEIKKLNDTLLNLDHISRVDIGTIDRPPAYGVSGVSYGELHEISMMFDKTLPIHIASRQHAEACHSSYTKDEIINTLDKRPLSEEDTKILFDKDSLNRLNELILEKKISIIERSNILFYIPSTNLQKKRKKA